MDRRRWRTGERGGLGSSSLLQMVVVLLLFALVVYELVALGTTAFQVDDRARKVAAAAADAYASEESDDEAREAATAAAQRLGVTLTELRVTDEQVVVLVRRQAPTLVADRIGPLEERTVITARGRSRWR